MLDELDFGAERVGEMLDALSVRGANDAAAPVTAEEEDRAVRARRLLGELEQDASPRFMGEDHVHHGCEQLNGGRRMFDVRGEAIGYEVAEAVDLVHDEPSQP